MRGLLLFLGWSSMIGSLLDGAIMIYAFLLAAAGDAAGFGITVDGHLKDHLSFIYWVKDVAYFLFPTGFVDWLFGLPALLYFPFRVITSIIIGGWALSVAARMK